MVSWLFLTALVFMISFGFAVVATIVISLDRARRERDAQRDVRRVLEDYDRQEREEQRRKR